MRNRAVSPPDDPAASPPVKGGDVEPIIPAAVIFFGALIAFFLWAFWPSTSTGYVDKTFRDPVPPSCGTASQAYCDRQFNNR